MATVGWDPVHLDGLGNTDTNFCFPPHTPRTTTLYIHDIGISWIVWRCG